MNEPTESHAATWPRDTVRLADVIARSSSANALLGNRVRAMRARGMDNRIVCDDGPYVSALRASGIPVKPVGMPRHANPFRMALATFEMAAWLRRERIDAVHTHGAMAGILGRVAAWIAGVPVILHTMHGLHLHESRPAVLQGLHVLAEKLCGTFTTMLLSQNRVDLEFARRQGLVPSGRLRFIGNGIDLDRFEPSPRARAEAGALTVICTAPLEHAKNHRQLFEAFAQLPARGVRATLLLVGDGELRHEYRALCASMGIADRVEFLGYRDDVPALLARADVSVLTSESEGIPRVLLEAMAMELPVVGTRVPGTSETVRDGETGYLVEYGDAAALAERLARLASNAALRERLGRRGREIVLAEYDEEHIVESLATVYHQALRVRGTGSPAGRPQEVKS